MAKHNTKLLLFFSGTAVIFLSGLCCWFTRTFGKVHITQILWHIEKAGTIKGFDEIVIIDLIKWLFICSALCLCWFSAVYGSAVFSRLCGRKAVNRTSTKADAFLWFCVLLAGLFLGYDTFNTFSLYDLVKMKSIRYSEENDFILNNYQVPKRADVVFEKKNNLVIILMESFGTKLCVSEKEKTAYIPKLQSLYPKYQHHEALLNCHATTYTIGALTAWFFGVPLKLPLGIKKNTYGEDSFLPNARSVFDIMAENAYACYLFMGSTAEFAGTNSLFRRGNFTVYDKNYYSQSNKIDENNRSVWGVYDFFLYDELYEKYLELRENEEPFVLFLQTIDTHFPGYCPNDKEKYGDIRDSWVQADRLLYDFMKKMERFLETDNVNILIFGDHLPMGEFSAVNARGTLFNLFAGRAMPEIPKSKLRQPVNPMDIAPTILQAAGAKWNNDRFGLGISIFSEEESFSQKEGKENLDEKLLYYSKFYDSFF